MYVYTHVRSSKLWRHPFSYVCFLFSPGIALDECHRAKNQGKFEDSDKTQRSDKDKGSKTAKLVKHLQEALPLARIIYVSATGASGVSGSMCVCTCVCMHIDMYIDAICHQRWHILFSECSTEDYLSDATYSQDCLPVSFGMSRFMRVSFRANQYVYMYLCTIHELEVMRNCFHTLWQIGCIHVLRNGKSKFRGVLIVCINTHKKLHKLTLFTVCRTWAHGELHSSWFVG